ncbi:hypothetical protein [Cellulosimicrobium sp. Marseille-Q4280]|uniref:hypothetical protein n=1 Tax=Cellulosimicrobium sp. Marseille-Q4280 TaxID=2937992 RepID=UPI00203FDB3A|nr:hypothetical protein [Cellulosimicrobium sp. Marseille-Q4280]
MTTTPPLHARHVWERAANALKVDPDTVEGDLMLERELILIVTMLGDSLLTPLAVIAVQQELHAAVRAGVIAAPEHLIDQAAISISLRAAMLEGYAA